jgi:hypothetical protein
MGGGGGFPGGGGGMMAMGGGGGFPGGGGGQGGGGPMAGGMGGPGGGGPPTMRMGGGPGGPGGGGGGMFGGGNLTDEQRTKMREIMQKAFAGKNPMEMTQEERSAAFAKVQDELKKAGINTGGARGPGGERKGGGKKGEGGGGERKGGGGEQSAEGGGEGRRGRRGGGEGGGPGGPGGGGFSMPIPGGFSAADLANAKLPPPPEETAAQLDALLRPGLLADVQIIVEKIPNAIHVPVQAVFEKEGKQVVYVRENGRFVARVIKPFKRSESVLVIAEGLKAGEDVAMQNPEAKPGGKKKDSGGGGGGGGVAPTLPMGKKG